MIELVCLFVLVLFEIFDASVAGIGWDNYALLRWDWVEVRWHCGVRRQRGQLSWVNELVGSLLFCFGCIVEVDMLRLVIYVHVVCKCYL